MNKPRFARYIIQLVAPVFWKAVLSIGLGSLTILSGIGLIGTSVYLISYAALQPSIAVLQVAIIGVRFFGLSRSVFRYLERITSHSVNLQMVSGLRLWFYKSVERATPLKKNTLNSGDLITRALQDIETLDQFFIRVLSPVAIAVIINLTTAIFIWFIDRSLGWFTLIMLAGFGLILFFLSTTIQGNILSDFLSTRGKFHSIITSMVEGVADIRVNGETSEFQNLLTKKQSEFVELQKKSSGATAFLNALLPLMSGLGFVTIFITSTKIFERQASDLMLIAVIALLVMASFEMYQSFTQTGQNLALSMKAVERIYEIVDLAAVEPEAQTGTNINNFLCLDIRDLDFSYSGNTRNVFKDLNFTINRKEKIALVGPSGAGKTSLINLVLQYWKPQSGDILLNKIPIQQVGVKELRNIIRTSSQNPFFFPETLRENLLLADRLASEEQLAEALFTAQCMEWVMALPQGLDTVIGDRGSKLSEGQRKRLDIARVLLSNPELVILDEPFAGLDQITARNLQKALIQSLSSKSLILITHNLIDLDRFDKILFLDEGKIMEQGDLSELMKTNGHFARMFKMQKNIIM